MNPFAPSTHTFIVLIVYNHFKPMIAMASDGGRGPEKAFVFMVAAVIAVTTKKYFQSNSKWFD